MNYSAAQYVPDFSWISTVGKDLSRVPEAIAVEQGLKEGRIKNQDIFSGVSQIVDGMDDEMFKQSFGKDKQTFLKLAQYGKTEKPELYTARIDKLLSTGYKEYQALENLPKAIGEITQRQEQIAEYQTQEGLAAAEEQAPGCEGPPRRAVLGEAPKPVTPTEVGAIAQKYDLPPEKLEPQTQQAEQELTQRQLGTYQKGQTQTEFLTGLEEAPTKQAQEVAKGLPTEYQMMTDKRLRDIAARKADISAQRADIAKWKVAIRSRKLTNDERIKILDSKAKNDVAKLKIQTQISAIKSGLSKAQKDVLGQVDPEAAQERYDELQDLTSQLYIIEENSRDYDELLKEKGGIKKPTPQTQPPTGAGAGPSRAGFDAWMKSRGQ